MYGTDCKTYPIIAYRCLFPPNWQQVSWNLIFRQNQISPQPQTHIWQNTLHVYRREVNIKYPFLIVFNRKQISVFSARQWVRLYWSRFAHSFLYHLTSKAIMAGLFWSERKWKWVRYTCNENRMNRVKCWSPFPKALGFR